MQMDGLMAPISGFTKLIMLLDNMYTLIVNYYFNPIRKHLNLLF